MLNPSTGTKNSPNKSFIGIGVVLVVAIVCGIIFRDDIAELFSQGIVDTPDTAVEKLEQYFNESTKTATFTYVDLDTPDNPDQEGQYWVDGSKFKVEFIKEDGDKRWIISPDGENAYFCYETDERCNPSMVTVENYLLRWTQPSTDLEELGTDEEYSCAMHMYSINKTFKKEGAANAYYVENITYCATKDKLVYREHIGHVENDDGSAGTAGESRFILGEPTYEIPQEENFFKLPYEVVVE